MADNDRTAADDLLDGTCCEVCGEFFDDILDGAEAPGHPRMCAACKAETTGPERKERRAKER